MDLRKRVEISIILPQDLKNRLLALQWDDEITKMVMNFFSNYGNAEKEIVQKLNIFISQKIILGSGPLKEDEKQILGLDEISDNLKSLKLN